MLGPSPYVLINMGARYVPCMRNTAQGLNASITWPCPNSTSALSTDPTNSCAINNLCGFGDGPYSTSSPPRQWFRFIIPMFLHAGFIHIGFNMLLQLLMGREMEQQIGSIRFIIVYLSSGIFGFVLGGNFAPEGIASTGASGALFGIIALFLLDLLYHWGERRNPWADLAWIVVDIVISFVLGLLPGLDNFSHIGGFLMGLVLGVCLLHSPDVLRQRVGADLSPYASVRQARKYDAGGLKNFLKEPVGFFKGRKPLWWAWWLVRAAALVGVLAGFVALLENFYAANPTKCNWCQYLSCLVRSLSLRVTTREVLREAFAAYQELVRYWQSADYERHQQGQERALDRARAGRVGRVLVMLASCVKGGNSTENVREQKRKHATLGGIAKAYAGIASGRFWERHYM